MNTMPPIYIMVIFGVPLTIGAAIIWSFYHRPRWAERFSDDTFFIGAVITNIVVLFTTMVLTLWVFTTTETRAYDQTLGCLPDTSDATDCTQVLIHQDGQVDFQTDGVLRHGYLDWYDGEEMGDKWAVTLDQDKPAAGTVHVEEEWLRTYGQTHYRRSTGYRIAVSPDRVVDSRDMVVQR